MFRDANVPLAVSACALLPCLYLTPAKAEAGVRLPNILGSHMVLQRDTPLTIWGWTEPGAAVTVEFAGATTNATANDQGEWRAALPPLPAGGPHEMIIRSDGETRLTDVLVGDVWFCSGQSNMEMGLGAVDNGAQEVAAADFPRIRCFEVGRVTASTPQDNCGGEWYVCSPDRVGASNWGGFSAVGYFFGRKLHQELGVPIGLIDSTWGGTLIEPWTAPEGFASEPSLASIPKDAEETSAAYRAQMQEALERLEAWTLESQTAIKAGRTPTPMPHMPRDPMDANDKPMGLYNAMVRPILPLAIRGVIWYQGESNIRTDDEETYFAKMRALINGWRKAWGREDLPFYYVQLAPFNYRYHVRGFCPYLMPRIWEAQAKSLAIPNTGMAVITDLADLRDVHPRRKQKVGERLALWALAKTYGKTGFEYSSPIYDSMTVKDGKAYVTFSHDAGLKTNDGQPVTWLQIAGENRVFYDAQSKIENDTLVVWHDKVAKPTAVRFGWYMEAEPNLFNGADLPASPFRTDDWEEWAIAADSVTEGQR